jgi:hypothetical protein
MGANRIDGGRAGPFTCVCQLTTRYLSATEGDLR